jgi:hypothetical protein
MSATVKIIIFVSAFLTLIMVPQPLLTPPLGYPHPSLSIESFLNMPEYVGASAYIFLGTAINNLAFKYSSLFELESLYIIIIIIFPFVFWFFLLYLPISIVAQAIQYKRISLVRALFFALFLIAFAATLKYYYTLLSYFTTFRLT